MRRFFAAAAALTVAGLLAGSPGFLRAQSSSPWPTFHGNAQRNGTSSVSGPTTPFLANQWTLPGTISSSPAVDASDIGYIGDNDGNVYALSPSSTNPKWSFQTHGRVASSPAVSADGSRVYVGNDIGNIYALNASNGQQIWTVNIGGPVDASPLLSADGSTVYTNTVNGTIYALNTSDGSQKWKVTLNGSIPGSLALSPDGTIIYAATSNATISAIPSGGLTNGANATGFYLDADAGASPAVDQNNSIYATTILGTILSFNQGNSQPRWSYALNPRIPSRSTPALWNSLAIYGDANGHVYAINQSSGQPVWTGNTAGAVDSSPVVASGNSLIYVGSADGNLYAFNGSGGIVWTRVLGTSIDTSPALGPDGSLWVATSGGVVDRLTNQLSPPPAPPAGATSVPGATATATTAPATTLSISLLSTKVHPGSRQAVAISTAANTVVHIRVNYPNGDHQSGKVTTNVEGAAIYAYTQGESKIKHNAFVAKVTVTDGKSTATKTYSIAFGAVDVSIEPRTQKAGKFVTIYVHSAKKKKVRAVVTYPNHSIKRLQQKTGPKGFATWRLRVPKHKTKGKNHKVIVRGVTLQRRPNVHSQSFFTIK